MVACTREVTRGYYNVILTLVEYTTMSCSLVDRNILLSPNVPKSELCVLDISKWAH